MCDKCNDTGYIYFGDETFTGQEQIACDCKCCKNIELEDNKMLVQDMTVINGQIRNKADYKNIKDTKDIKLNNTPDSEFDADELALGIKTEMEHTDNKEEATSIAKDHLQEDKFYYTKLVKMEAKDALKIAEVYKGITIWENDDKSFIAMIGAKTGFYHTDTLQRMKDEIDKLISSKL
jgi:hypothetical protein